MAMLLLVLCMAQSMQLYGRIDGVECAQSSVKTIIQFHVAVHHLTGLCCTSAYLATPARAHNLFNAGKHPAH